MVKKMRIISAALAAVLAAASLTGCGTSGNSTATSADTSKSESTDTSAASDEKDSKEVSLTVLCGYASLSIPGLLSLTTFFCPLSMPGERVFYKVQERPNNENKNDRTFRD